MTSYWVQSQRSLTLFKGFKHFWNLMSCLNFFRLKCPFYPGLFGKLLPFPSRFSLNVIFSEKPFLTQLGNKPYRAKIGIPSWKWVAFLGVCAWKEGCSILARSQAKGTSVGGAKHPHTPNKKQFGVQLSHQLSMTTINLAELKIKQVKLQPQP